MARRRPTVRRDHRAPDPARVVLDPRIAFGLPTINGIRTEAIAELAAAGEPVRRIVAAYWDFGVTPADISHAVAFERSLAEAA